MNISKSAGLIVSERVYSYLQENLLNKDSDARVDVGLFTNGREEGYVYRVMAPNRKAFTWCTYEHRNSDSVIVNGHEGYWTDISGDLPYNPGTKFDYLFGTDPQDEAGAAKWLADAITKFWDANLD